MKKLITIFTLLLFIFSCTTQKNKVKEKTQTEIQQKEVKSIVAEVKSESNSGQVKTDSTNQKTDIMSNKSFEAIAQNLSLKNNGKCLNGGEIRFMKFTDLQGNKTEIPVNDNTELSFNSNSEVTKENIALKSSVQQLKIEKIEMQSKIDSLSEQNEKMDFQLNANTVNSNNDVKQNSLSSYLWCILITLIVWECGQLYFKNLL